MEGPDPHDRFPNPSHEDPVPGREWTTDHGWVNPPGFSPLRSIEVDVDDSVRLDRRDPAPVDGNIRGPVPV